MNLDGISSAPGIHPLSDLKLMCFLITEAVKSLVLILNNSIFCILVFQSLTTLKCNAKL